MCELLKKVDFSQVARLREKNEVKCFNADRHLVSRSQTRIPKKSDLDDLPSNR